MLDYALLKALGAVAHYGSFERAAKMLNITPSAVSQRIKLLEEKVGRVLIQRGQPCQTTEAGAFLCRHVERVQMLEAECQEQLPSMADAMLAHDSWPTLRIAANDDSVATWLMEAVTPFAIERKLLLDIVIDDQDHTVQLLRAGAVQGAVTTQAEPVQGCRSYKLGQVRYLAVCSQAFHQLYFKTGVGLAELQQAPSVAFNRKDALQRDYTLSVAGVVPESPVHWLPNATASVNAIVNGLGWGVCPEHLVQQHLDQGTLVELIPGKWMYLELYWQSWRLSIELLDSFSKALRLTAEKLLW